MAWYDPDWSYRKPLVITGGPSGAQTDFQIDLAVAHVTDHMQTDFDDLRFTQANGTTLIDAWLEVKTDNTSAAVWAEFPSTPANTVEQTYYMYYGNGSAVSDWDGAATFAEFLDKNSTAGWTHVGGNTITTSGDFLRSYGPTKATSQYSYRFDWASPSKWALETRLKNVSLGTDDLGFIYTYDGVTGNRFTQIAHPWKDDQAGVYFLDNGVAWTEVGTDVWTEGTEFISVIEVDESDGLGNGSSSAYNDMYIRWMFLRKHASGPPTYAFGAEESAPTGHPVMLRWGGTPGMQYTGRRSW
jgi:hypothetical protein